MSPTAELVQNLHPKFLLFRNEINWKFLSLGWIYDAAKSVKPWQR